MNIKVVENRESYIDFIRGLIILDMVFVHYSSYFSPILEKIINYGDIAMEGFLFISGYMVGRYYLQKFEKNKVQVTLALFHRAIKLILIQYLLIFTASLPHYVLTGNPLEEYSPSRFLYESLTFKNQVGLLHILPTFIPLFLIGPLLLFLFSRGYQYFALLVSGTLFILGQRDLDAFSLGIPAIFPVVLWQIYFILGCYVGKLALELGEVSKPNLTRLLVAASGLLFCMLAYRHFSSIASFITGNQFSPLVVMTKFPLNTGRLLFSLSMLMLVFSIVMKIWTHIDKAELVQIISMLGKHALLTFVIHVYFLKAIQIAFHKFDISILTIYCCIVLNLIASYLAVNFFDQYVAGRHNNRHLVLRYLFK